MEQDLVAWELGVECVHGFRTSITIIILLFAMLPAPKNYHGVVGRRARKANSFTAMLCITQKSRRRCSGVS